MRFLTINARPASNTPAQLNIEKVFNENIMKVGFTNRVTHLKGDSAFVLIQLIKHL